MNKTVVIAFLHVNVSKANTLHFQECKKATTSWALHCAPKRLIRKVFNSVGDLSNKRRENCMDYFGIPCKSSNPLTSERSRHLRQLTQFNIANLKNNWKFNSVILNPYQFE